MKKNLLFTLLFSASLYMSSCLVSAQDFSDVSDKAWYKSYVDYASENGLVNGTADGVFSPDDSFTVAQCITVASRIHSMEYGKELDIQSGKNWYDGYVKYATDNSIITDGQFDSFDNAITREDAVNVLINSVKKDSLKAINSVHGISDLAPDDDSFDNVLSFYNAGILGGSDNVGSFLPSSSIKRSEISAIICRLINNDMRIDVDIPYVGDPRYLIDDVVMKGKWGIQSGWNYDHKYSLDNISGLNSFSIGADEKQAVNINRPINAVSEGNVVFDTNVTFVVCENGGYVSVKDDEFRDIIKVVSKNDLFVIICGDKVINTDITVCKKKSLTHSFIFRFDLEKDIVSVTVDSTDFDNIPLKDGISVSRLYVGHDGSGRGVVTVESARCTADYRMNENFLSNDLCEGKELYGSWQTQGKVTLSKILSERNADVFSAKITDNGTANHAFEKIGGKFVFEANLLYPDKNSRGHVLLTSAGKEVAKISYSDNSFTCGNKVLRNVSSNVWTNVYVQADCISNTAVISINGKVCGEIPFDTEYIDGVKFESTGNVMWFDDVKVYQTFERDDYPTVPEAVNEDGYEIGVNVCNLWRNGHCDEGYNAVAPFEELYPLIGLADEGLPELADWENKQMAEHGIDFQHICWYAPQADTKAPVKATSMPQIALNDGYLKSKYGDYVKFCIMWENANGAVTSFQQFKDYIWPYFKEYYLCDERYYTINNRPLITIWKFDKFVKSFGGTSGASEVIEFMREDVKSLGYDGMIIWFGSGTTQEEGQSVGADAVYPYNYGTSGDSADYQISVMEAKRKNNDTLHYVPGVSVGFNAIGRHDRRTGMISDKEHEKVCQYIKNEYLPSIDTYGKDAWKYKTLIVSTWNEYTEGTYVAPNNLCGFDYIDNVRKYFTTADEEHVDIIPSEKVKDRLRNIYPDGFSPLRLYRLEEDERDLTTELRENGISIMKWDFSKEEDRKVWRQSHGIDSFQNTDTSLHGITTKSDFGIMLNTTNEIKLDISKTKAYYLHVRMKTSIGSMAELFFRNVGSAEFTAKQAVSWDYKKSDEYVDYYIDLGVNVLWSGTISNIRFDPMTIGGEFDIQLIEFLALPEEDSKEIIFDYTPMLFDFPPVYDKALDDYIVTANPRLGFFTMSHSSYEFDIDKGEIYVMSLFGDLRMTIGSDKCIVNGKEESLGMVLTLRDGLPCLPIKKYMSLLGYTYKEEGNKLIYDTLNDELKETAKEKTLGSWEFNNIGNMSGWQTQNCVGNVTNGLFELTTTNSDPAIFCKNLNINLVETGFKTITVGIKYVCERPEIIPQLFFVAGNEATFNETASVKAEKQSGTSAGKVVEFVFDMSQNPRWFGLLSQIRFDPYSGNGIFSVDYIRLS